MELYASGTIDHSDVNIALDMQNPVSYVRWGGLSFGSTEEGTDL